MLCNLQVAYTLAREIGGHAALHAESILPYAGADEAQVDSGELS